MKGNAKQKDVENKEMIGEGERWSWGGGRGGGGEAVAVVISKDQLKYNVHFCQSKAYSNLNLVWTLKCFTRKTFWFVGIEMRLLFDYESCLSL